MAGGQTVFLNGELLPLDRAHVSPLEHGFLFGDGGYELIPVYSRRPFRLAEHLARLQRTLDGIRLANPYDTAAWTQHIATALRAHVDDACDLTGQDLPETRASTS